MTHHQISLPFYYQIPTKWQYQLSGNRVAITNHRQRFATYLMYIESLSVLFLIIYYQ